MYKLTILAKRLAISSTVTSGKKGGKKMGTKEVRHDGFNLSRMSRRARVLIIDTSILMYEARAIETFQDNVVVLGIRSSEELDKLKESDSQKKSLAARNAIRVLSDYEARGSLKNGVSTGEGFLVVDDDGEDWEDLPSNIKQNDTNALLAIANHWRKKINGYPYDGDKPRVAIVTKNMSLRFKANSCGIPAENYEHDRLISDMKDLYTGLIQIELKEEEQSLLYNLCHEGSLKLSQLPKSLYEKNLFSNQFVRFLTSKDQIGYGIYKADRDEIVFVRFQDKQKGKIVPLNPEQACAENLLYDKEIILVTLVGEAGTGKTLLSLNAGLNQVTRGLYDKLIVFRPNIEVGREIGFLKGDLADKMAPWRSPIEEAIRRIYSLEGKDANVSDTLAMMMREGILEVRPINFERGDSIHNAFIIVEEGQNLRPSDLRMLITRVAEGSKIVINGDLTQIDDPFLDFGSSGLTKVVEKFKGLRLSDGGTVGHITLVKTERSAIAEMAARILA
ncbi:MAG TPA: PhoH family protein [Candidatus Paceibacterota bacterium]|nr:PhoH family protein [Candidatus Paceibacterota bacterium]